MSSGNRTVKYENLLKALRKHYKPLADPPERSVLEHLLYACCLEDARVEQADEGFAKLQQTYFDWNEVRVTTVAELAEALKALPFPMQAASRIKQCLQSIFETRYQYDIDDMKKANLGKATAELEAWKGMSHFAVAYVSQHAL
jgi:endonuclease III